MNWIAPMEPIGIDAVKDSSEYIHETKWDGIRGLVYIQNSELKIYTKGGKERTAFYPELGVLAEKFKSKDIILDGEMVVFDKNGLPSFYSSLVRESVKSEKNLKYYQKNYPVNYFVFDILQYKDKLLTGYGLRERKQLLGQVTDSLTGKNNFFHLSEAYTDGRELFKKMKEKNMEGIVSKKITSPYISGKKHDAWYKTKFTKKMLCIIGGILWKNKEPYSLALGVKIAESEKLNYVGKASLGLKASDFKLIKEYREKLIQEECPFSEDSAAGLDTKGNELTWTNPFITCWVNFLELSNDGHLRQPKLAGFTSLPASEADGKVLTE
ncbi:bifunctional non-homologous end joining protein LigD [Ruminiclostridium sufflavum DSM 19573]|uniref:DNA ligase (ATP) n=1 Tax=Ruminiclostridium sufflavum DSM 19573 TaxID=1121337 RepID=A0A318XQI6_9FIRM|nr:RNA ligase family protein [Ruminiclostridium sufflavum]PYG88152.1 bifunctional non-homologous end joining protein LigD [Ruminiclostridium sufflavum DSM 19573]